MINRSKMDYNSRFNHTTSPASIKDALGLYLLDEKTSSWHYEVCLQSVSDSIRNGNAFSWIFCSFHSMKLGEVLCEISSLYQKRVMDEIYLTGMIFVNNILWEKIFYKTLVTMQLITSCFTHLIAKSTWWENLKNWHKLPHIRRLFYDYQL